MLNRKLFLSHYILSQFGFHSIKEISHQFNDWELPADVASVTPFYHELAPKVNFPVSNLKQFDENLIEHLNTINAKRNPKINLKYFQFFSLLFTEYFLYRYFNDESGLLEDLNQYKTDFCLDNRITLETNFQKDDLNKLAYWMATGSGKTLILHFNILQYSYYAEDINNFILLTPNESLSKQHLDELRADNIDAEFYLGNKSGNHVKVIDIYKIKEAATGSGATVGVTDLEDKNAIFVDEGHKGSGTKESTWRDLRERMGERGFTFEYSATFGQIDDDELFKDYAKSIIIDYSFSKFHSDGFGKDYWIHNISDTKELDNRETRKYYLLLNLLLFVQQKLYYHQHTELMENHNIEDPLLAFVGTTVIGKPQGKTKQEKENEQTLSDISELLAFFRDFLKYREKYLKWIKELLNRKGLFANDYHLKLDYLLNKESTSNEIYQTTLKEVFNSTEGGELALYTLKKAGGEIAVKIKNADHYFGLINIGDASAFKASLESQFIFESDSITNPLFENISNNQNPVNILFGARKFIEGWNNYRVSSIGLINFGRGEGSMVIQLFGRGVRIKGKDFSLKRTPKGTGPEYLDTVETLNVFGLNADYMKKFREELENEGVRVEKEDVTIPVNKDTETIEKANLSILQKKPDIPDFNKQDVFKLESTNQIKNLNIDISTKKYLYVSHTGEAENNWKPTINSNGLNQFTPYFDWDHIYNQILDYKKKRKYYNLRINREGFDELFKNIDYQVLADNELAITTIEDIDNYQKLAIRILEKYVDRFYNRKLKEYEGKHLEEVTLDESHDNLISSYNLVLVSTDEDGNELKGFSQLKQSIDDLINHSNYPENLENDGLIKTVLFDNHLYQPLLEESNVQDQLVAGRDSQNILDSLSPEGLNKGEKEFVEDLQKYLKGSISNGKEYYLLRNQSRTGFGFYFEAAGGFFPDFILWLKDGNRQYLTFIDPHGLRNEENGFNSPRIQLHKEIKNIEANVNNPNLVLNSFILLPSNSKWNDIEGWNWDRENYNHVKEYAKTQNILKIRDSESQDNLEYLEALIGKLT